MHITSEADLNQWQRSWGNYHVLLAMAELGLFDLLEDRSAFTAEDLAAKLNTDARAMDICARILVRAGLLTYDAGLFGASSAALALTQPLRDLKREWRKRQNFADLLDTVRSGQPALVTSGGVVEEDKDDAREFLTALHRQSAPAAQDAARVVAKCWQERQQTGRMPDHPPRILDLGGGHGRYSAAFADTLPGAEVTLFDRAVATEIAHELSGNAFHTRSGDFLRDNLGGPYDIVFMAYVVSGIAIEEVHDILGRVRTVLAPGGCVIIEDMFIDPAAMEPAAAIDFNLILLLENKRGRFRTVDELAGILQSVGFLSQQFLPITNGEYGFLIGREVAP